jgi:hypothetical protein
MSTTRNEEVVVNVGRPPAFGVASATASVLIEDMFSGTADGGQAVIGSEAEGGALAPMAVAPGGTADGEQAVVGPEAEGGAPVTMAVVVGGAADTSSTIVVVFRVEGTSLVPTAVAVNEAKDTEITTSNWEALDPAQTISAGPEWSFDVEVDETPGEPPLLITIYRDEGGKEVYSTVHPNLIPTIQVFLEKVCRAWGVEIVDDIQGLYRGNFTEAFIAGLGDDETWRAVVALKSQTPVIYEN